MRKLTQLQELVIRTAGSLCTVPGDHAAERAIFRAWVGQSVPHPTLHFIGVWQRFNDDNGGIVSQWAREDGVWEGKWFAQPEYAHMPLFL